MKVRDVTLRDGLQSIQAVLSTLTKVDLYTHIHGLGVDEVQLTSFVSPKRLPQLADAEALWDSTNELPGARSALVANKMGFYRALEAGVESIEMVLALSPSYHCKNSRVTQEATYTTFRDMSRIAHYEGVALAIAFANAWHCSFEGATPRNRVREWVDRAVSDGATDLCLADTTGQAAPDDVFELISEVRSNYPQVFLRAHLHCGPNGIANAHQAALAGINAFDATVLGIGGSPFAGEVGGNLSHRQLWEIGLIDLDPVKLIEAEGALVAALTDNSNTVEV